MGDINRIKTGNRMSQIVIHNDTIYLACQVGNLGDGVAEQTKTLIVVTVPNKSVGPCSAKNAK